MGVGAIFRRSGATPSVQEEVLQPGPWAVKYPACEGFLEMTGQFCATYPNLTETPKPIVYARLHRWKQTEEKRMDLLHDISGQFTDRMGYKRQVDEETHSV